AFSGSYAFFVASTCSARYFRPGSASSAPLLVHASHTVPPQSDEISPTGTFSAFWRSRPKKYPTAEKLMAVSGVHSSHTPSCLFGSTGKSYCGSAAGRFGTVNSRMFGLAAAAATFFPWSSFVNWLTRHSMFDWPEQTHTSPTATFLKVILFLPSTNNTYPVPAGWAGSLTSQFPSLSAFTLAPGPDCLPTPTMNSSPGSALPQNTISAPCWRTM